MTLTTITFSSIGTGTVHTFAADGDALYVRDGVAWGSRDDNLYTGSTRDDLSIVLHGDVISADTDPLYGADSNITIGATGSYTNFNPDSADAGLALGGGRNSLTNHGEIIVPQAIAVLSTGANSIVNTGLIDGASGVLLGYGAGARDQLVNSGLIRASGYDDAARSVVYNNAVFSTGGLTEIVNLAGGQMIATSAEGAGVRFYSYGGSRIDNAGEIASLLWWGIDFSGVTYGDPIEVENSGTVAGGAGALLGSAIAEHVINRGVMQGDVDLAGGDDIFDGRGGTVTGRVTGGVGDDTFIVDDAGLVLIETAGAGTDEVRASVNWTLGNNFETLNLIGSGDISGQGNGLANRIDGNSGDNRLHGHEQSDTVNGRLGDDVLRGGLGSDRLTGGSGDDLLRGGAGGDRMSGGDGEDVLIGGQGQDKMAGGGDNDVFRFTALSDSPDSAGRDRITDFVRGEDLIDLRQIVEGQLQFIGSDGFSGTGQAEVRVGLSGDTSLIRVDANGDGSADMRIDVLRVADLEALDFLL